MARGLGGLTALRAALGGVAGGLQGLGEMREARRLQEQQALAAERQRAMDELAMLNQGFMRVEDMAGERQQTGAALSRALSSAAAMMRPGGMAGGAAPSLQQGDLRRMAEAPGMESPQQRVTLGGATYQRESPTAAALRRAELETARERMAGEQKTAQEAAAREQNVTAAMNAYKLTRPQAEEFVRTGKSPFVEAQAPMTEYQRASLAEQRAARADARAARAAAQAAGGAGKAAPSTGPTTFSDAANYLGSLTEKDVKGLNASGVYGANLAQTVGGMTGGAADLAGTTFNAIGPREREYLEYAGSVADAWARKSEVGVLTNQDINRYRNLVIFQAGDKDVDKWRKVQRAQKWAATLAQLGDTPDGESGQSEQNRFDQRVQRGMNPTDAASLVQRETQASTFPATTERRGQGAPAGQQDADLVKAQNAISNGAPKDAVVRLYEKNTGRKWPGG